MDQYVAHEPERDPRDRAPSRAVAGQAIRFEAMAPGRGGLAREDERPRTESYAELWQRASIYMRRT